MNEKPEENVILYSLQVPGTDITQERPSIVYETPEKQKMFHDLAKCLQWDSWVWGFEDLEDFTCGLLDTERMKSQNIWILSVPPSKIKWSAFTLQAEGKIPMEQTFFPDPKTIRAMKDVPIGFVQAPVCREWVLQVGFYAEGLLSGRAQA